MKKVVHQKEVEGWEVFFMVLGLLMVLFVIGALTGYVW